MVRLLIPTVELSTFVVASTFLFYRKDKPAFVSRMPFVLELLAPLLVGAMADFTIASSSLFPSLSGESLTRYFELLLLVFIITGVPWAIINLRHRRAVILNVIALAAAVGWMILVLLGLLGSFVSYI